MADSPVSQLIIDKEMGYSRLEFINQFKIFARELNYTLSENSITIFTTDTVTDTTADNFKSQKNSQNTEQLIITFSEQADRSIGSLNIPRLFVNFHFINYTELQHKQFIKKFDLSFQRGGG